MAQCALGTMFHTREWDGHHAATGTLGISDSLTCVGQPLTQQFGSRMRVKPITETGR
jgi:hypothetical protein